MPQPPAYLAPLIVSTILAVIVLVSVGAVYALRRTNLAGATQLRTWLELNVPLAIWFAVIFALSSAQFFRASPTRVSPLPVAVFPAVIVGLWFVSRSRAVGLMLDQIPAAWLVALQFYRNIGAIFVVMLGVHLMPPQFALPAGIGDIIVGVLAIPAALLLTRNTGGTRTVAFIWNALGLLDFAVALTCGFLSSPGPLQRLALDQPNLYASAFPFALIPAFLVPLSTILHGLSIRQLSRLSHVEPHLGKIAPATPQNVNA